MKKKSSLLTYVHVLQLIQKCVYIQQNKPAIVISSGISNKKGILILIANLIRIESYYCYCYNISQK